MSYIGLDIGGTKIRAVLYDNKIVKDLLYDTDKDNILEQLNKIIDELFTKDVKGIGIGVPGAVKDGVIYDATHISLDNVDLKKELKFDVPIFVENDGNCFVLGEYNFGSKKKNMVGLVLGTGVGGGVLIDGKVYRGKDGAAGEFGAIAFKDKDFDYYCSGRYFGNNDFGENMAYLILGVVVSLNPEVIVLGGSVVKSYSKFEKQMKKKLKELLPFDVKIVVADEDVNVLGAVSLCF
jgi:glucokinase